MTAEAIKVRFFYGDRLVHCKADADGFRSYVSLRSTVKISASTFRITCWVV